MAIRTWASANGSINNGATLNLTDDDILEDGLGNDISTLGLSDGTFTSANGSSLFFANIPNTYSWGNLAPWNTVKTVQVQGDAEDLDGNGLALFNIVDVNVKLTGKDDVSVSADGAKRGFISTDRGDDVVEIGLTTNGGTADETFDITTNRGHDMVVFTPAVNPGFLSNDTSGAGQLILADLGLGNDYFDASAVMANAEVKGDDGKDTIMGSLAGDTLGGGDDSDLISAMDGDDEVSGGNGNDFIAGGTGHDMIKGGIGNDVLRGDEMDIGPLALPGGNDTIYGGDGNDTIGGRQGADLLFGDDGNDEVRGGQGEFADTLHGGNGNDDMSGDDGDDLIFGDNGNDLIKGGAGNDTLDGGNQNDTIGGSAGDDLIYGRKDNDVITGGGNDDTIFGNQGADNIDGGSGNDYIHGGDDNDTITGDNNDDTIEGGNGNDELTGGAGLDVFLFDGGFDKDTITDFVLGDDILRFDGNNKLGNMTVTFDGTDSKVAFTNGSNVTVENIDLTALAVGDWADFI